MDRTQYEAVKADRSDPAYKQINPAGAVPALDTGEGWILTQAGAILHYLARRFPDAKLGSDGSPRGEAEIDRWSSFFTGDLHPAFFPVFAAQRYTTSTDEASLAAVKQAGLALVRKQLTLLDTHLKGRPHIVGDRWSIIDAYAFPMLRWAQGALPTKLADYSNVAALLAALDADPTAKTVLSREAST